MNEVTTFFLIAIWDENKFRPCECEQMTNEGNAKSKTYQQVIVERVKVDVGNVRSVAIE